MKTSTTLIRSILILLPLVAVLFLAIRHSAQSPDDPELKILKMGLGSGTIVSDTRTAGVLDIDCGAVCNHGFAGGAVVMLTAREDGDSTFAGWDVDPDATPGNTADCTGMTNPCRVTMDAARSLRPTFNLRTDPLNTLTASSFTPEGIQTYLDTHTQVDTAAEFVRALPDEFKQNWILMARSESLQTGTAESPRLLLPSADGKIVFTVGMTEYSSYPGSHPNAIEFMQWDPAQKNFRFHEIVLNTIRELNPDGDPYGVIAERRRRVSADDAKCPKCHSTRNIASLDRTDPVRPVPGTIQGTDGTRPGTVIVKNKPNWDPYDSWAGMLGFNRDRIYQGSVEAAAFRKIFNPWTWSNNQPVRQIIEQLRLQAPGTWAGPLPSTPDHRISRQSGGENDGRIRFGFDPAPPAAPVVDEPTPTGSDPAIMTAYLFDRAVGTGTETPVTRGGLFVTLHHTFNARSDEGRGVHLFDLLAGQGESLPTGELSNLNARRVASEINNHHFATGSLPIDVRPLALAIATGGCFTIVGNAITSSPSVDLNLTFFNGRNGMTIDQVVTDTRNRAQSLPRRKADIQRMTLDRLQFDGTPDPYLSLVPVPTPTPKGLLQQYLVTTPDTSLTRLRQEVFRRPTNATADLLCSGVLCADHTTSLGHIYVDREQYFSNTEKVALYRYFLEPLGVPVDKWSVGVRGRSRTYAFADVFGELDGTLLRQIGDDLRPGTGTHPIPGLTASGLMDATEARMFTCSDLMPFIERTVRPLPPPDSPDSIPRYTDVQRIFNKSCIECHGGLDYPPYGNVTMSILDLSENETPPAGEDRLDQSYRLLITSGFVSDNPLTSRLYRRITDYGALTHPYEPLTTNEYCPGTLMPCGGPPLSKTDIETIRRWIIGTGDPAVGVGVHPNTRGDPHIETVNGVPYDFQSAGEFILLRDHNLEIQVRQTAIGTEGPLPNEHTGLSTCVSVNTAAAIRVGPHRITYQPNASGEPDPQGLQLRIDGKLTTTPSEGIVLDSGGRIIQTTEAGGIRIEAPGGTAVTVTPHLWPYYQVWFLDIELRNARGTDGLMGIIGPGQWLPALPDGTLMGSRPREPHQRYVDLYDRFENAWRVTNANSLFDYAPGTSTSTFSLDSWPAENPQVCIAPPRPPGGPVDRTPLKALSLEEAQKQCANLVADRTRANCIQDVMVTGDPVFAQAYLRGEEIARNKRPDPPMLGLPEDRKTDLTPAVDFTWNPTSDSNGDPLTYRHCVWPAGETFSFNKCAAAAPGMISSSWRTRLWYPLLILLLGLLLILILLWLGLRRKPVLLYVLVVLIVVGVVFAFYLGRKKPQAAMLAKSVSGLQSGGVYYWKVIAEDGKGGATESETRRFEVK